MHVAPGLHCEIIGAQHLSRSSDGFSRLELQEAERFEAQLPGPNSVKWLSAISPGNRWEIVAVFQKATVFSTQGKASVPTSRLLQYSKPWPFFRKLLHLSLLGVFWESRARPAGCNRLRGIAAVAPRTPGHMCCGARDPSTVAAEVTSGREIRRKGRKKKSFQNIVFSPGWSLCFTPGTAFLSEV